MARNRSRRSRGPLGGWLGLFRTHKEVWTPGIGRQGAWNPRIDALQPVQAPTCTLKTPFCARQSCTHEATRGRTQVVWRGATLWTLRRGTKKSCRCPGSLAKRCLAITHARARKYALTARRASVRAVLITWRLAATLDGVLRYSLGVGTKRTLFFGVLQRESVDRGLLGGARALFGAKTN